LSEAGYGVRPASNDAPRAPPFEKTMRDALLGKVYGETAHKSLIFSKILKRGGGGARANNLAKPIVALRVYDP